MKRTGKSVALLAFAIFALSSCKDGNDFEYQTTSNGLKYHFFHEEPNGKGGNVNDIYTFNATFSNAGDSIFLQREVRFLRAPIRHQGDFQEALSMLKVGDSAVFQMDADSFYNRLGQNTPDFFRPGDPITIRVGVKSILDEVSFRIHMYEKEITEINEFISRKDWDVILDSTGVRYEITEANPGGVEVEVGDTVDLTSLFWYTIEEKVITKGKDNDNWTIVVGDSNIQAPGVSRTVSFLREGESVRTILPYSQAFGEAGNAYVPPFTTICIEMKVAAVRKLAASGEKNPTTGTNLKGDLQPQ